MNQGSEYIKKDADDWFDRNSGFNHNIFTEYFLSLFSKKELANLNVAEFGVGRGGNVNLLSHYVSSIDGYDGSCKSIDNLKQLSKSNKNINGFCVNLSSNFKNDKKYDVIIYGFFTYMINNDEFNNLIENSKKMLNDNGYIFIYDFLSKNNKSSLDSHNKALKVYKRNLDFYLKEFNNFNLIDFRLFDNRNLSSYLLNNKLSIDSKLDEDCYNWTFSGLFKIHKK
jgi:SAM-dependent methyltransferase